MNWTTYFYIIYLIFYYQCCTIHCVTFMYFKTQTLFHFYGYKLTRKYSNFVSFLTLGVSGLLPAKHRCYGVHLQSQCQVSDPLCIQHSRASQVGEAAGVSMMAHLYSRCEILFAFTLSQRCCSHSTPAVVSDTHKETVGHKEVWGRNSRGRVSM